MDGENLFAGVTVGVRDLDVLFEATRSQERIVDHVPAVSRSQYDQIGVLGDAVEFSEQLGDDALGDFVP